MRKSAALLLISMLSGYAFADQVSDAYDEAYAVGRVSLEIHKACEKSIASEDMNPCQQARKSYEIYKQKTNVFMSSVKPQDLFKHVIKSQMDDLALVNKQLGQSMDYIAAYLDAKK